MDSFRDLRIFETNWNDLPIEIKIFIIQKITSHTKLSLRAFSVQDKKLVDSVRNREIYELELCSEHKCFTITIKKTADHLENVLNFTSIVEFQETLTAIIRMTDYIKIMTVEHRKAKSKFLPSFGEELVKVEDLNIYSSPQSSPNSFHILTQIDPHHLKKLELHEPDSKSKTCIMPQVINASTLHLDNSRITIDQLLSLKCYKIGLTGPTKLDVEGFNRFIQNCVLHLDEKPITFWIQNELQLPTTGTVLFDSPSSRYQLEVCYSDGSVEGKTICKPDLKRKEQLVNQNVAQKQLRRVEYIEVASDIAENRRSIIIRELNKADVHYCFDAEEELHSILSEALEGIDRIDELLLNEASKDWNVCIPRNRNLTIRKLKVVGSDNMDFLKMVNPFHLEDIVLFRITRSCGNIYDMSQVIHAKKLYFTDCLIRDDQLLKLDAVNFEMQTSEQRCNLIDHGINEFLKRKLQTIENNCSNLKFIFRDCHNDSSQILEGFDIVSSQIHRGTGFEAIVNSPHPEVQMKISRRRHYNLNVTTHAKTIRKAN